MKPLGVYVHVPYCRTLCPYCDFVKKRTSGTAPSDFADAICREVEDFEPRRRARSVFFGGGTPSLLSLDDLERILEAVRARFDMDSPEVTLEANPDDMAADLALAWERLGINRVSLGVQSFNDTCLRYLGRRHDAHKAREACRIVSDTFGNWSLDLIFGAPPIDAWAPTVEEAAAMAPPHLSAYGLTYEPGTPFEKRAKDAVDEDTYLAMYHRLRGALHAYDHYEISNFAKPGFRCAHNMIYWHNHEYAGFGPGAYSYTDGVRARNLPGVEDYLREPGRKVEALRLDDREIRVETVIQHLRLHDGLTESDYAERFDRTLREDFGPQLDALERRGLLTHADGRYRPSPRGFDLNNEIGLALVS